MRWFAGDETGCGSSPNGAGGWRDVIGSVWPLGSRFEKGIPARARQRRSERSKPTTSRIGDLAASH